MSRIRIALSFSFIILYWPLLTAQVKTLKDSLLELYTEEQLRIMTPRDRYNAVRVIRGQEPLPPLPKEPEYDFYGIKIIKNFPADSIAQVINSRIDGIKDSMSRFRQEVFPNAWVDVVEGYGLNFYKSFTDRFVDTSNVNTIRSIINESEEETPFSNFSKRVYYFDESNRLKLITIEATYNVNEGKKFRWDHRPPLIYSYQEYYVWNDSLIHGKVLKGEQIVGGYPDYTTQEEIDSTLVFLRGIGNFVLQKQLF